MAFDFRGAFWRRGPLPLHQRHEERHQLLLRPPSGQVRSGNLLGGADDRLGVLHADQLVPRAAARVGAELHRGGALHREQVRGLLPRVGPGGGGGTGRGGDLQLWNNCGTEVRAEYDL